MLSLVIQFNYLAFDTHLFWAALFGWYVICGAGPFSLDAIARPRTGRQRDSATPLSSVRLARLTTDWLGPVYQLSLRLWLGAAMLAAGGRRSVVMTPELTTLLLPVRTAAHLPTWLLVPGALLLVLGLATRPTAVVLLAALAAGQMTRSTPVAGLVLDADASRCWPCMARGACPLDAYVALRPCRSLPRARGQAGVFSGRAAARGDRRRRLRRPDLCSAAGGGRVRVTLIDRHNYHLFQPLLYQVATAGLSPGDIATPDSRPVPRAASTPPCCSARSTGVDRGTPRSAGRRAARALRLSGARHRRLAQLLRARRVGRLRARPEAHRGCHRGAPAHAHGLRARRGHGRRRGAAPPADFPDRRRRAHRRGAGWRHRRARAPWHGEGVPPLRPGQRTGDPGAGRTAHPADVPRNAVGKARKALEALGVEVLLEQPRRAHRRRWRDVSGAAHPGAHGAVGGRRRRVAGRAGGWVRRPTTPGA